MAIKRDEKIEDVGAGKVCSHGYMLAWKCPLVAQGYYNENTHE